MNYLPSCQLLLSFRRSFPQNHFQWQHNIGNFWEASPINNWSCAKFTVLQEQLQPMSDGKRPFITESLLCYSYKLILISPGIFHRALFEKWLFLVAEKSPASAKFTYSNLEAFNVHPPSYVILILKKMPFFIILLYALPDKRPRWAAENLCILWK